VLDTHRVIVSTQDVLLNALRHGYVNLGRDIGLLVFDEAHHAADKHSYNMVMQEFYAGLPPRIPGEPDENVRPMILGLTASPIFGGNAEKSFRSVKPTLLISDFDCACD
jgi:endoribonuclease Dicer